MKESPLLREGISGYRHHLLAGVQWLYNYATGGDEYTA